MFKTLKEWYKKDKYGAVIPLIMIGVSSLLSIILSLIRLFIEILNS